MANDFERSLYRTLTKAHAKMDKMGYPPAPGREPWKGSKGPEPMDEYEAVLAFHKATDATINGEWPPAEAEAKLRFDLLLEELTEVRDALVQGDILATAHELADMLYVVHGAAVAFGIHLPSVFAAVHEANMSKLLPDGTALKREDGKVLKGPNYHKPDIVTAMNAGSIRLEQIMETYNG